MPTEALQYLSFGNDNRIVTLLREMIDRYKLSTTGKSLTMREIAELLTRAVTGMTSILLENFPGTLNEKAKLKAQILEAVAVFYAEVIAPIDIKSIPNLVEGWVDQFACKFVVDAASGLVDTLFSLLVPKPVAPDGDQSHEQGDAQPLHNVVGSDHAASVMSVRMRECTAPE